MYITNGTTKYPCTGYSPDAASVRFSGVEGLTLPLTGIITLCDESDFELADVVCGDYARQTYEGNVLMLTNEPEPATPTAEELLAAARAAALTRIDGKCEAAIVANLIVDGVAYPMTRGTAQDDLVKAVGRANAGDTAIPYGPHGQFATLYTPAQVLAIDKAFYERGLINRTYYGLLQAWIGTESDTAVLKGIDYGDALPEAYTSLLTSQMTDVNIDASAFIAALTV